MTRRAMVVLGGCVCVVAALTVLAEGDWQWLFKGTQADMDKNWTWHAPQARSMKPKEKPWTPGKWHVVEDKSLECLPRCGYIWSKETYGDFVIDFEVKLSAKANSGLFFRADPKNCVQGGMEIQILDSYGKAKPSKHDMAALYDCAAPTKNMAKPAGEWQHMVLTAKGPKLTVELNGETVLNVDLDQWPEAHKNPDGSKNKFKTAYKNMPRTGYIGFQDHGHKIWLRNIKIKRLE
ncbi:MAG: DUF1080 domain-containing protein [Planctomycetes bacterium]|nr:DUF1080 domain-containing protein [Planctomycetota bacterium]